MNPEDSLDNWIERQKSDKLLPLSTDEEMEKRQMAATLLARFQEVDVPQEFARRLEGRLRMHIRDLSQPQPAVLPGAHVRQPVVPASRATQASFARYRFVALVTAICLVVLGITLYSFHSELALQLRPRDQIQSQTAAQIDELQTALADLRTTLSKGSSDQTIQLALDTVVKETDASRAAIGALPAGPGRNTEQQQLDALLRQEKQLLHQGLTNLSWPVRITFSRQLAALGDPVPQVKQIIVATQSNGNIKLTLLGANFHQNTEIFVNERQGEIIGQVSSTQLVVSLSGSGWMAGNNMLHVLNADGTAAQATVDNDSDNQAVPGVNGSMQPPAHGDSDGDGDGD